jgi:DNA-binding transcriptional LysR family regulator
LISKRLGECQFHLHASPAYLEAQGVPAEPGDLADHDCLTMSDVASPTNWKLTGRDSACTITIKPRMCINDFPSLRRIVADGGGITALPSYLSA